MRVSKFLSELMLASVYKARYDNRILAKPIDIKGFFIYVSAVFNMPSPLKNSAAHSHNPI